MARASNMTNTEHFINSAKRAAETEVEITHSVARKSFSYKIVSFTDEDKTYKVSLRKRRVEDQVATFITGCDCPNHIHRRVICKHMVAVSLKQNIEILMLVRDKINYLNKMYKLKLQQQQLVQ